MDLDPEYLISFPRLISNGKGTISIASSQTGYSLYYQAIEISNANYNNIKKIETDGKAALQVLNEEYDNLKATYDQAYNAWKELSADASEEEKASAKENYETAETNFNNKLVEYNNKVDEINNSIKALIPAYIESNWVKTSDGEFTIDLSQFSGNKAFAVWAKLVCSDGTTIYDEATYTMRGTRIEEVSVTSISLNKTSLKMTKGSNYTLVAKITPSNATNKLVTWSSDNEKVAKVNNGKVVAIAEGIATITATAKDGGHTATCKVTVTKKSTTPTKTNKNPDTTVANGKLPQTGSLTYIIVLAILFLSVIGIIIYKKVKYLNFK